MTLAEDLAMTVLLVDIQNNRFEDAIAFIQASTGVKIVVDWPALSLIGISPDDAVSFESAGLNARTTLRQIVQQTGLDLDRPTIEFHESDGFVSITSSEASRHSATTVAYDISAIQSQNADDDDHDNAQQLIDLIQSHVAPESWVSFGGDVGNISHLGDKLVVSTIQSIHASVQELLDSLSGSTLGQVTPKRSTGLENSNMKLAEHSEPTLEYQVFICHASEDKDTIAFPLRDSLAEKGLSVWIDAHQLSWGDDFVHEIGVGLGNAQLAVVVVSESSLAKNWPMSELSSLLAIQIGSGVTRILPLLASDSQDLKAEFKQMIPLLSGKLYRVWETSRCADLAAEIGEIIDRQDRNK